LADTSAANITTQPRIIIDQSVLMCLLDHLASDPSFEVMGYLGGKVIRIPDLDVNSVKGHHQEKELNGGGRSDYLICHVTHWMPSER
jgi:hypothetical protein